LSFDDKYNISLFNRDRTLDYSERVTISIETKIDNLLRNYAAHNQKLVSKRLEEFLAEEDVKKMLSHKKGTQQRPLMADATSIKWHLNNKNIDRIEAIKMLMALCPKKVAQELIEELEDWEREQRRKANEQ